MDTYVQKHTWRIYTRTCEYSHILIKKTESSLTQTEMYTRRNTFTYIHTRSLPFSVTHTHTHRLTHTHTHTHTHIHSTHTHTHIAYTAIECYTHQHSVHSP